MWNWRLLISIKFQSCHSPTYLPLFFFINRCWVFLESITLLSNSTTNKRKTELLLELILIIQTIICFLPVSRSLTERSLRALLITSLTFLMTVCLIFLSLLVGLKRHWNHIKTCVLLQIWTLLSVKSWYILDYLVPLLCHNQIMCSVCSHKIHVTVI